MNVTSTKCYVTGQRMSLSYLKAIMGRDQVEPEMPAGTLPKTISNRSAIGVWTIISVAFIGFMKMNAFEWAMERYYVRLKIL